MSTFIGGPANGVVLSLHRAAICMRVVQGPPPHLQWDALDTVDDTPEPDEKIYLYVAVKGTLHRYHMRARKPGVSGWYEDQTYEYYEPQPSDAEMRTKEAWHKWCAENREAVLARHNARN